jgi:hypothetical protein
MAYLIKYVDGMWATLGATSRYDQALAIKEALEAKYENKIEIQKVNDLSCVEEAMAFAGERATCSSYTKKLKPREDEDEDAKTN